MALSTLARFLASSIKSMGKAKAVAKANKIWSNSEITKALSEIGEAAKIAPKVAKVSKTGKKLTPSQRGLARHRAGRTRHKAASERRALETAPWSVRPSRDATERLERMRRRRTGLDEEKFLLKDPGYKKHMAKKRYPRVRQEPHHKGARNTAFKFQEFARKKGHIITNDEALAIVKLNRDQKLVGEMVENAILTGRTPTLAELGPAGQRLAASRPAQIAPVNPNLGGIPRLEAERAARLQYESQLTGLNAPNLPQTRRSQLVLDDMLEKFLTNPPKVAKT